WLMLKQRDPHKSIFSNLDYSKTILYYAQLFGRERVLVLPFEALQEDVTAFSATLANWLQVDPAEIERLMRLPVQNPGTTTLYAGFYKYFRRFLPRWLAKQIGDEVIARLPFGRKLEVSLDDATTSKVRDLCAEGNRWLERIFGLNLRKYNYLVADDDIAPS